MKIYYIFFTFILSSSLLFGQSLSGPESIEYDEANNRYLISNSSNGQILELDSSGNLTLFTGLVSSPHGLTIVGNVLYVCDGGGVKGFDLTSANSVFDLNLGANFLNGITSDGVDNIWVTDFNAKVIYRISISGQSYSLFVSGLSDKPNGIVYDGDNNRLVFVNWGPNANIMQVDLADSSASQITNSGYTNIDGIDMDCKGNFYIIFKHFHLLCSFFF